MPDSRNSWYNDSMNLEDCEKMCLADCNCTAYSDLDVRNGGSGCLLWFGELIDIREFSQNEQNLYVRVAASELGTEPTLHKCTTLKILLLYTQLMDFKVD